MPIPSTVAELLRRTLMPTTLSSAELAALDPEITERSILSATVDVLRRVQGIRESARAALAGEASHADARRLLREYLAETGYEASPEDTGTIKDLGTLQRQRLIIDTNVSQVSNYVWKQTLQEAASLTGKPAAWELIRTGSRKEPRKWDIRWAEAYAELSPAQRQEVDLDGKRALIDSPIWTLISRFKTGYPPFDYNSGMGVRSCPADGLTPAGSRDSSGLNDTLAPNLRGIDNDLANFAQTLLQ